MNWQFRKLWWRTFPGSLAMMMVAGLLKLGAWYPLEQIAYQGLFQLRGPIPWDDRVVVVAIDETSLKQLGRFPWNRRRYADLLKVMTEAEPSAVVLDILFPEQTADDPIFAAAIDRQGQVVLARAWDSIGTPLLPDPILRQAALTDGHILKQEDADGIVRRIKPRIQAVPALSFAAVSVYSLVQAPVTIPNLEKPLWVNWPGPVKQAPQYSFIHVIQGHVPPQRFTGKIVLVGVTAAAIDSLSTPFDRNLPASGVFLHAAVINNLLQQNALKVPADGWSLVILLLAGPGLSLLIPRRQVGLQLGVWIGSCLAWGIFSVLMFQANYWIPVAMPILLITATGGAVALQEQFRLKSLLHHHAYFDRLTGLPNRALLTERLQQAIARSRQVPSYRYAVCFLDVDRFKVINDSLGHSLGDLLLIEIGRRLKSCLRAHDCVARLGGDEFTILLEDIQDVSHAEEAAERIHQAMLAPMRLEGQEIFMAVSIGIAIGRPDYEQPEDLLRDADTAMYRAKALGRGRSALFHRTMHTRAVALLQLENDLRRAIDRQEFEVYYQPLVCLQTGTLTGFEALVRWQHEERGLVMPSEFILVAEETGLISALGEWVLQEACRQLKVWQQQFPLYRHLKVNVNLSGVQLAHPHLVQQIEQALISTGLSSHSLKLEITESALMTNGEMAIALLKEIQALQIDLCLDDFGIGYSSLGRLHRLPIQTLKIDRSFIQRLIEDQEGWEIVWAITTLAQTLGLEVVAEGVETINQVGHLRRLYCQTGQGYFFSAPVNRERATEFLTSAPDWLVSLDQLPSSNLPHPL